MRALLLGALLSTTAWAAEGAAVDLTSGWLSVLDLEDVQTATSADPTVAAVAAVDHGQVLLLGVGPGQTTISVWTRGAGRREYPVTVTRFTTLQPFDGMLRVSADQRRALRVPSLTRVVVGDAATCDAVLSGPDELELVPRRAGTTTLLVWTGGDGYAHRRLLLVTVESGGVVRSADETDAVLTEPLDGRVVLIAGERATLETPPPLQFAVRDPAVARVHLGRQGELVVEGRAAGATHVLVWTGKPRPESHYVVVHPRDRSDPEQDPGEDPPSTVPLGQVL